MEDVGKNLENILNKIESNDMQIELNCCFYNGTEYKFIKPNINNEISDKLHEITNNFLKKGIDKNIEKYNPIGSMEGIIEYCSIDTYDCIEKFIDNKSANEITIAPNWDVQEIDFLMYRFHENSEKDICFFRQISKMKSVRKGIFTQFFNNDLKRIEENKVLLIDDKIDFIIYQNHIYIFRHSSFERIFNIEDEFRDKAKIVLDERIFREKIINFDNMQEAIMNNKNYIRRVSKLLNTERALLFLNDLESTQKVINKFNLDIQIDDNRIVYRDKSQLGNFINLMQDAYYKTLIGGADGVDVMR